MIGDYLELYTYEYLLSQSLARISDAYDKRQGAIMWDAVAPCDYMLALFYVQLRKVYKDTFADTATGEYLDKRVSEQGMTRYLATQALKRADFADEQGNPITVPLGARFTTVSSSEPINYYVESPYYEDNQVIAGAYQLRCEKSGTIGNNYVGELLNITFILGIAEATMSTLLAPAQDDETDEELRIRYFLRLNQKPFGGNVAQYDELLKSIDGVGDVQVYPVWNGGGTVKLSVVDAEYNPISSEFINTLEDMIDPENSTGQKGLGLGFAPIGHKVTVVTPTEVSITISAKITLKSGYTLGQVTASIKQAISEYIDEVRRDWGISTDTNEYFLSIYIARITMAILSVNGVANATQVKINDSSTDYNLEQTATTQTIPKFITANLT